MRREEKIKDKRKLREEKKSLEREKFDNLFIYS